MSKRIFTRDQISELLKNHNVLTCSEKSITYHPDFKVRAMRQYQEGLPVIHIFKQAGFNVDIIGRKTPKHCIEAWKGIWKEKGREGLLKETRGGHGKAKPRTKHLSGQEKLKYLEAQVAYLKAENAFLAKLRKQR